jgi:hypothetical protein
LQCSLPETSPDGHFPRLSFVQIDANEQNAERCEIAIKKFAAKFGLRVKGCELRVLNPLTLKPATPSGVGDGIVKVKRKHEADKVPA